jgi:hypothetical protein
MGHIARWHYVFKILDSQDRHIVRIFNKETICYATIPAIPNFRLKAADTFRERDAVQPETLRGRFYPGRQWGEEFVIRKPGPWK